MRSMSYAFTAVLIIAALAAPSALAKPAPPDMIQGSSAPAGLPTWPEDPQPITRAETPAAPADGFPWETLGIALAAAGIGLAGAVAVVRVRRRVHRTHPIA
jgi:hypothetical protein